MGPPTYPGTNDQTWTTTDYGDSMLRWRAEYRAWRQAPA